MFRQLIIAVALSAMFTADAIALAPRRIRPKLHRNDAVWSQGCLIEKYYKQRLDHFHFQRDVPEQPSFQQRYFVCEKYWSNGPGGVRGPIFFYAGNEANVELYVNATGLIWENAQAFGALIIFVEHRYYGKTQPFGPDSWQVDPSYLTVEQALADYATLLWHLKADSPGGGAADSPVIAFGGSYGGMLSAWMRVKYPHVIAGAVAASAPVAAFPGVPGWRPQRFWEIVTYDATAAAGSAPECVTNVRLAFGYLRQLSRFAAGRASLSALLRLCSPLEDEAQALAAAYWLQGAFDAFAMGNYPFSSSYISDNPDHPLPAWPMRAACTHMVVGRATKPSNLIEALRDAAGVLYNVTGDVQCYDLETSGPAAGNQGPWDYQWCTELMGQELPYYPTTGVTDMFWDQGPFNLSVIEAHCREAWGVTPRPDWSAIAYGGLDYRYASNIVFSNGGYDPWSAFGVLSNVSDSVVAISIPEGAHHLDLMYSTPSDPPSVVAARQQEMALVRSWIAQHRATRHSSRGGESASSDVLSSGSTSTGSSSS
ncbi:hypothetical protein HYH02_010533 [Chlamydomonas schloesseri]|uniref:Lysosomal Pro-X carboxypeptidase n=1 Tax=Chlamydomonas schloesseri TaxID=2026947 RepID=A0A835W768_9CHLO|nr:hypothetical protein HYH02_010533 [Chlamydomonas schloesseri]|eukprot:KAG2439903.1 hypothetical protein HYH02_010533 [Chlamydomonas schloesseri]